MYIQLQVQSLLVDQLDLVDPGFTHMVVHFKANLIDTVAQLMQPHGVGDLYSENFILIIHWASVLGDVYTNDFSPLGFELPALKPGR